MTDKTGAATHAFRELRIDAGLLAAGIGLSLFVPWSWHDAGYGYMPLSTLDDTVGWAAILAVFLVRRWPVELAVVLTVLAPFYGVVYGAAAAAQYRAISRRPWRITRLLAALSLASAVAFAVVRPDPEMPGTWKFTFVTALQGCAIVWGLFVRRRRLEAAELLAARNQPFPNISDHHQNRATTLCTALKWQEAVRLVRVRAGLSTAAPDPTPMVDDIPQLVARANGTGTPTTLLGALPHDPPATASRTAYRIVREALASAGRHDGSVTLRVTGRPGETIDIEVTQEAPAHPVRNRARRTFGRAFREAVELVEFQDGKVTQEPVDGGGWRLRAWLPWPA